MDKQESEHRMLIAIKDGSIEITVLKRDGDTGQAIGAVLAALSAYRQRKPSSYSEVGIGSLVYVKHPDFLLYHENGAKENTAIVVSMEPFVVVSVDLVGRWEGDLPQEFGHVEIVPEKKFIQCLARIHR